ncbi:MAG: hypothetical protein WBO68_15440 [Pyrinomonadaceae bacterium]|nr:hypothetical protein [Acidobacteriota bacterium]
MKIRWRYGIIAGLFLAVFSLYPQMKMVYLRGQDWNGHYAYNDIDEVAYAAYVRALIDGRPRKNDPYTGRDDSPETPQEESLFSIQFVAPYTIALPARLLGVPATWAMTIAGALAAFLTALAIFWLLASITGDSLFAMAGSLITLAGGALFAGEGAIGEITGWSYAYPYFPGFRRYIPAMAFPAFFLLVGLVWKVVGSQLSDVSGQEEFNRETREIDEKDQNSKTTSQTPSFSSSPLLLISLSTAAFAYTVFSYFYVWTSALAWLGCVGLVWLAVRPKGFVKDIRYLIALGIACVVCLAPYAYLLSKRSHTMDDVQLLVRTHMPDLIRVPEFIGFAVLASIGIAVTLKKLELKDRAVLFTASLALVPLIVFNQQVITGQSLQPIHYQVFIGNYVAGLSLVMLFGLFRRRADNRQAVTGKFAMAVLTLIAAGWGFVECHYTVRILDDVNVARDEAFPVARRLDEIAKGEPNPHASVVMHFGMAEGDDLPTLAPQSVLWARHQHVFAGVTWQENKERYYQYLYYMGVDERHLAAGIKSGNDFVSVIALFGWGRHTDRLNAAYTPLTFREIDDEMHRFGDYLKAFDPLKAGNPPLNYAISETDSPPNFANIDKWYERGAGEIFGKYTLYRLKLR